MQGLTRRWKLADGHRMPGGDSLLERVLAVRGVEDPSDVEAFLAMNMAGTHDPGLLPGIDAAAADMPAAPGIAPAPAVTPPGAAAAPAGTPATPAVAAAAAV